MTGVNDQLHCCSGQAFPVSYRLERGPARRSGIWQRAAPGGGPFERGQCSEESDRLTVNPVRCQEVTLSAAKRSVAVWLIRR